MVAVSIVVATKDRAEMLSGTLASIRDCLRDGDELIVVDSASRDPAVAAVARESSARLIRLDRPGTSRARNAGWRAAGSGLVAFTDDDCLVASDWTASIEAAFADESIGFVTGKVVGDRSAAIGTATVIDEARRSFGGDADPSVIGSGANMAFRKVVLEGIDGFDEALGPGTPMKSAEDHDVFLRALAAGWMGSYEPSMVVTHRLWRSRLGAISREFAYGVGAGALSVKSARHRPGTQPSTFEGLWENGVATAFRHLRRGYESGAVAAIAKAIGVVVGRSRASRAKR